MIFLFSNWFSLNKTKPTKTAFSSSYLVTEQIAIVLQSGNYNLNDLIKLKEILMLHSLDKDMNAAVFLILKHQLDTKIDNYLKTT